MITTIFWTAYLAAMIFISGTIVFDMFNEDTTIEDSERVIYYILDAALISVWYMFYLH